MSKKKQEIVEAAIVFGVMTGLLLPVRILFYTYISTNWFGSFGLISIVSVIMVLLIKKKKLGRFGQIFERQMNKVQHGKRSIIVYGQTIIFLLILGGNIFAIEMGNTFFGDIKAQIYEEIEDIDDPEKIIALSEDMDAKDWLVGFFGFFLVFFLAFPQASAILAVMNETFQGWPLHFYTVAFVESLEVLGMLIYYRYTLKKNQIKFSK